MTTMLSRLHPYPAMLAEPLAEELAQMFVRPGDKVLDPFCGTGRTLLAATERGGLCTGVDVNPLAVLVTRAKVANATPSSLRRLAALARDVSIGDEEFDLLPGRRVVWIKAKNRRELCALIACINTEPLPRSTRLVAAAVLSATVREVALVRRNSWKLHRLSRLNRERAAVDAVDVFCRRLDAVADELSARQPASTVTVVLADARALRATLRTSGGAPRRFDLVMTSPPYGDSASTVQYGGVSGLCLGVLRHLRGINLPTPSSGQIDRRCLGGELDAIAEYEVPYLARYWAGGKGNPSRKRVLSFLRDMDACCGQIAESLKAGGRAVFVVARRTTGGRILRLDLFLAAAMRANGLKLQAQRTRKIKGKVIPIRISRSGVVGGSAEGRSALTMRHEIVMVFEKS